MRKELAKVCDGSKHNFEAVVARFGSYRDSNGDLKNTILLLDLDLIDYGKRSRAAGHVWVSKNKRMTEADGIGIQPGDTIRFQARTGPYTKLGGADFSIKNPSSVRIINHSANVIKNVEELKKANDELENIQKEERMKEMKKAEEKISAEQSLPETEENTVPEETTAYNAGDIYDMKMKNIPDFVGCVLKRQKDQHGTDCVLFARVMDPIRVFHYNPESVMRIDLNGKGCIINMNQLVFVNPDADTDAVLKKCSLNTEQLSQLRTVLQNSYTLEQTESAPAQLTDNAPAQDTDAADEASGNDSAAENTEPVPAEPDIRTDIGNMVDGENKAQETKTENISDAVDPKPTAALQTIVRNYDGIIRTLLDTIQKQI